jgi:hypothetical protein
MAGRTERLIRFTLATDRESMRQFPTRALFVAFFGLYTVALVYPGLEIANRIHPLIFGLPFSLFWITAWIVMAALVLWVVWRAEPRAREEG